jgi:mercuric ion transport protein
MNDRTLTRVGVTGAILAAICCAAPLLVVGLPVAGFGAWLAGAGLVMLP